MYRLFFRIISLAALMLPLAISAQKSSINAFSPYTFYGLGELAQPNSIPLSSMGGIGVAYWNPYVINLANPASYSSAMRKTFLFDFSMSGKSSYLKSGSTKSAYNGFSMNDVSIQFPVYKGIGIGVSVSPVSAVGYRTESWDISDPTITDIGQIKYTYEGEGGISQLKTGIGMEIFKGFSLGADLIYYMGSINRTYIQTITPITINQTFGNISLKKNEEISKVLFGFGAQYDVIRKPKKMLTVGATYQPKATLTQKTTKEVSSSTSSDSIYYNNTRTPLTIPTKIAIGVFYRTDKMGVGLDYSLQDWKGAFEIPAEDNISLRKVQSFNLGAYYTPDRMDIRSAFRRWTYRAGFKYSDTYLVKNNKGISEKAITFGIGAPLNMNNFSEINIGFELGTKGTASQGLIKENYFKISIGLSLFGEHWFVKQKYY